MSRIYNALKRAAEQAKQRGAATRPVVEEKELEGPEAPSSEASVSLAPPAHATRALSDRASDQPQPTPAPSPPQHAAPSPPPLADTEAASAQRAAEPVAYRTQIRKLLQAELDAERDRQEAEGRYPFEGRWLTLQEIRSLRRRMRWRDLAILLELLLLFVLMGYLGFLLYAALTQVLLPRAV